MLHIVGEWFHCAYCPKDLCDSCAEVDTHDNTHLFVVFKSDVNMQIFRCAAPLFVPPYLHGMLIGRVRASAGGS